jgi:CubicO group peptidase (beta-lactamase class C family)
MPSRFVVRFVVALAAVTGAVASSAPASIRRLDGSTITIADAEAFARKTLESAHVTGAQIAVLDRGRLVWSAAYGLRRREPARWRSRIKRGFVRRWRQVACLRPRRWRR